MIEPRLEATEKSLTKDGQDIMANDQAMKSLLEQNDAETKRILEANDAEIKKRISEMNSEIGQVRDRLSAESSVRGGRT